MGTAVQLYTCSLSVDAQALARAARPLSYYCLRDVHFVVFSLLLHTRALHAAFLSGRAPISNESGAPCQRRPLGASLKKRGCCDKERRFLEIGSVPRTGAPHRVASARSPADVLVRRAAAPCSRRAGRHAGTRPARLPCGNWRTGDGQATSVGQAEDSSFLHFSAPASIDTVTCHYYLGCNRRHGALERRVPEGERAAACVPCTCTDVSRIYSLCWRSCRGIHAIARLSLERPLKLSAAPAP